MYLSREKSYYVKLRRHALSILDVIEISCILNGSFLPLMLNGVVPVGVGFVGDSKLVSGFHQTYEKFEKGQRI